MRQARIVPSRPDQLFWLMSARDFDLNSLLRNAQDPNPASANLHEPPLTLLSKISSCATGYRCTKLIKGDGQEKRAREPDDDGNKLGGGLQPGAQVSSGTDPEYFLCLLLKYQHFVCPDTPDQPSSLLV